MQTPNQWPESNELSENANNSYANQQEDMQVTRQSNKSTLQEKRYTVSKFDI